MRCFEVFSLQTLVKVDSYLDLWGTNNSRLGRASCGIELPSFVGMDLPYKGVMDSYDLHKYAKIEMNFQRFFSGRKVLIFPAN